MRGKRIYFLSSEATPFVKVGGLGDVAGTLPLALRSLSDEVDVRLAIPFHPIIRSHNYNIRFLCRFDIPTTEGSLPVDVYTTDLEKMPVYFIDGPPIRSESSVYSIKESEDVFKYAFFSIASLGLLRHLEWKPDVIHANDWHTSIAVYAVGVKRSTDSFYGDIATLLTVHNLPYMGGNVSKALETFDLPKVENSPLPEWALEKPLPLGLLMADHIVTVSPSYAQDILTPEYGSGLHEFLASRRNDISGILNGIDTKYWNPATDSHLVKNYNAQTLEYRIVNKLSLQEQCNLEVREEIPLLSMISRFDFQKGIDLAIEALHMLSAQTWQAIFLGQGDPTLERAAMKLQEKFTQRVRVYLQYNEPFSHQIYSAADMILVPSRYEPCGLVQMIAMRYGCVPIARATGGLKDTIVDFEQDENGVGFLFHNEASSSLAEAISRALKVYADKPLWYKLQKHAMEQDVSWERSAQRYMELYLKLCQD